MSSRKQPCTCQVNSACSPGLYDHDFLRQAYDYKARPTLEVVTLFDMLFALNLQQPESNFDFIKEYTGKPVGAVPPLDDIGRLGSFTQFYQTFMSVSASIRIGFTGFGAYEGSLEHKIWITDYGISANQADPNPDNGVDGWTYGVGYRLAILMNKNTSELKANIAAFAANATLNNARMMVQVVLYGMPSAPPIPITDLSNFDVEAYGKYIAWQNSISKHMNENRAQLIPTLTHAAVTTDFERYLSRLNPVLFALRRLEDRHSFTVAMNDGLRRGGVDTVALRAVYAKCTGNSQYLIQGSQYESAPISDEASVYAKSILTRYDNLLP